MNLTIDRQVLLDNLNIVQKGLPAKTTNPLNLGIKFYTTDTDLYLTTTNSSIAIEVLISDSSLKIIERGETVVPGRFLIEIVKKINTRFISLYLYEKILVIKGDRSEFKLAVMEALEYPKIDFISQENGLSISADMLKSIIKETTFVASPFSTNEGTEGINLVKAGDEIYVYATDSYRFVRKNIKLNNEIVDNETKDFNIIIPAKTLDDLGKIIDSYDGNLNFYLSDVALLITFKNICFQTSLIDKNYPNLARLIEKYTYNIKLTFNKDLLMEAIDRVSLLSQNNIIKLMLKKDRVVEIYSNIERIGDAKEEIIPSNVDADGPLIIIFSSKNIMEALKTFISTEITISFVNDASPFILTGEKDIGLTHLLLPMRQEV